MNHVGNIDGFICGLFMTSSQPGSVHPGLPQELRVRAAGLIKSSITSVSGDQTPNLPHAFIATTYLSLFVGESIGDPVLGSGMLSIENLVKQLRREAVLSQVRKFLVASSTLPTLTFGINGCNVLLLRLSSGENSEEMRKYHSSTLK